METIYHILEVLDGERYKGFKILPYAIAQRLKWSVLQWVK